MLKSKGNDSFLTWYLRYLARTASRNDYLNRFFSISPTVDMYFRTPMAAEISGWKGRDAIRAIGPNVFVSGDQAVIVRYASDRELRELERLAPKRTMYVLDDLLTGLNGAEGLPSDYFKKLAAFATARLPRILEIANDIVAPNEMILAQYPEHGHSLLGPCAMSICKNFDHIEAPSSPFKVILTGTRSHLADIQMIAPTLAALLKSEPDIHLTTFLGNHVPDALAGLPNCDHRVALPWPLYKRFLARRRYHVALHPTRDTAFNRARSWSKILDHAAFGAASLFSPQVAFRDHLENGVNALFCPDPENWSEAIHELKQDRGRVMALARAGAEKAKELGDPRKGREFWTGRLDLKNGLTA